MELKIKTLLQQPKQSPPQQQQPMFKVKDEDDNAAKVKFDNGREST